MQINELKLVNFRNHTKFNILFDEKITLITGPNGIGKTNLLEAINFLSTGKSIKARYDKDLIHHNKNFATAAANILNKDGSYFVELQVIKKDDLSNLSTKKAKVNKVPKSVTYFSGIFNSVIFTPEDLNTITGSPSDRRRYVDSILVQTDRLYKKNLSTYTRAIRQRNKILEKIAEFGRGWDEMGYWTKEALTSGLYIQDRRKHLFEFLDEAASKMFLKLNNKNSELSIGYKENKISEERLEKHKDNEVYAKTTLVGPHRDDFLVEYNKRNIAEFGSRGELRSAMLSLKIAEIEFIEKQTGERPVLLLDDIFSELDDFHKNAVMDIIDKQQTIITSIESLKSLSKQQKVQEISLA